MDDATHDTTDLTWLAGLARALLRDAHAAEDLVQDTLLATLDAPPPEHVAPRTWLAGIARRLAARRVRTDQRRARRERRAARAEALPDTVELLERAESAERVAAAVRELAEPYGRTLLLHYLEGLSAAQIADREGRPEDTVRWRLRRGLALLRQTLHADAARRGQSPDAASLVALLLPLTRLPARSAAATASASSLIPAVATGALMKLAAVTVTSLGLAALWYAWGPAPPLTPPAALPATAGAPLSEAPPALEPGDARRPEALDPSGVAAAPERDAPESLASEAGRDLFGVVVDLDGRGVEGATVYVMPHDDPQADAPLARTLTDGEGRFRLASEAWQPTAVDLGVRAHGFLRRMVADVSPPAAAEGLLLRLDPGRSLEARVVDARGLGVPDLALLACSAGAGVGHVSPSQMRLRADGRALGPAASSYEQCLARTDSRGFVRLAGLPVGDLALRSLDPGWTLDAPDLSPDVGANPEPRTWLARPRLGVVVEAVDASTGRPLPETRAVFRVEVVFADGGTADFGQWVGRGPGSASFRLGPDDLPPADRERTMVRATFHGQAGTRDTKVPWRAETLADPRGVHGVARAKVVVEPAGEPPTPDAWTRLTLEVRDELRQPWNALVRVAWSARLADGSTVADDEVLRPKDPGRFALDVPVGDLALEVTSVGASGSLPAWTGRTWAEASGESLALVDLIRGASASVVRPDDWSGHWFLTTSWREPGDSAWRGRWTYSTSAASLELTALRPAEWRFVLRRRSPDDPDALERVRDLSRGGSVRVDS